MIRHLPAMLALAAAPAMAQTPPAPSLAPAIATPPPPPAPLEPFSNQPGNPLREQAQASIAARIEQARKLADSGHLSDALDLLAGDVATLAADRASSGSARFCVHTLTEATTYTTRYGGNPRFLSALACDLLFLRSRILLLLDRGDEALAALDEVIALEPDWARYRNARGLIERAAGQLDAALTSYTAARDVATDPDDRSEALAGIGATLTDKGDFTGAARVLDEARGATPDARVVQRELAYLAWRRIGGAANPEHSVPDEGTRDDVR